MIKSISKFILLRLLKWKIVGEFPTDVEKSIIIFAPHTSYWDGFLGKLFFLSIGIKHKLLMSKKYFWGPFNWIFRSLGFLPVDGVKGHNAILETVKMFESGDHLHILICPEGHLRLILKWNPGFLLMARRANVPIVIGYLDYAKKEAGVKGIIPKEVVQDTDEVWKRITDAYEGVTAKYPENFKLPENMNKKVRVRFAPSPTGPLHIGGVRTALYNYLFAKQNGGEIILRIEDTDSGRTVEGSEDYIKKSFEWLGLEFDESPWVGGKYGPYRQSERREIYKEYVDKLISEGKAYICFDTPEELEAKRKESNNFQYNSVTRGLMRNSLSMELSEVSKLLDDSTQYTVRFKIEPGQKVLVRDLIRGDIEFDTDLLDDKIIWKSKDQLPTYHLANIVDDHLMKISHVIRGEEWIASAPLHILIYQALGWKAPEFAHVSDVLKPEGPGKLNKRDGAKFGFPVFPLEWKEGNEYYHGYREDDWYPEAVLNNIALIGWNPGTEQEIFSLDELIKAFDLKRCSKSGGRFNLAKAKWFNHEYLLKKDVEEIVSDILPRLGGNGIEDTPERVAKVVSEMKDRVDFARELVPLCSFFWASPVEYDEVSVKKYWKENSLVLLTGLREYLESLDWNEGIKEKTLTWIYEKKYKMGDVMNAWRVALVGKAMGPDMFFIAEFIGRDKTLSRLDKAIEKIKNLDL